MTTTRTPTRRHSRPAPRPREVDPRLQARRRQVARREGRRRLWLVAALTVVATLALGAIAAAKSTWLDIESVTVVGAGRADPQQIVTASGVAVGDPLVELDPGEVAEAVARVPWVAEAEVNRGWRGAVTIEVTERVAVLALPAGTRFALVDRTGRQLEIVAAPPEGLLLVRGLEASGVPGQPTPDQAQAAAALVEQLTPAVAQLTTALVSENGQLMAELSTGGRVNFGDDRLLAGKMIALETVLNQVDLACLAVIDVRVPHAPTVRRTGPAVGRQTTPEATAEADSEEPLGAPGGC